MGSYLDASFGYGIVLPGPEDDEEYTPSLYVQQFVDDEDARIDWYEVSEALAREFDLVSEMGYVHDDGQCNVLFVKPVLQTYGVVKEFPAAEVAEIVRPRSVDNLRAAAEKLGIPFKPAYILVASYG